MNSENGGLSPSERQRQAAAEIARKKVLAAYSSYRPKSEEQSAADNAAKAATDWKRYHSAWQNYYQKYYSDYYSKAAREFVAGERQRLAQEKAAVAAEERRQKEEAGRLAAKETMQALQAKKDEEAHQAAIAKVKADAEAQIAEARQEAEETNGVFVRRLKSRAAKKSSTSEKTKNRRRRIVPLLAGVSVMLIILFLQYNRLIFAPIAAYVSPGDNPSSEITALDPTITASVSPDPKLIIPSLNIEVPIVFGVPLTGIDAAMNQGVAQFRIQGASAYPGEIGNLVISGHSAGDIYSNNQYKFIFSGLERLKEGDLIYINYESVRYTYQMTNSAVVEPTDIAALTGETDKPRLILITCTPLGTTRYRLLIYADQISPSYKDAEEAAPAVEDTIEDMPKNDPTFFENMWNWLTGQ